MPRRRRAKRASPRPWTPEEDAKLREICAIGLASEHWHLALPRGALGDILDRRLTLQLPLARLI